MRITLAAAAFVALALAQSAPAWSKSRVPKEDLTDFVDWGTLVGDQKVLEDESGTRSIETFSAQAFLGKGEVHSFVRSTPQAELVRLDRYFRKRGTRGCHWLGFTSFGQAESETEVVWSEPRRIRRVKLREGKTQRIRRKGKLFVNGERRGNARLRAEQTFDGHVVLDQPVHSFPDAVQISSTAVVRLKDRTLDLIVESESVGTEWFVERLGRVGDAISGSVRNNGVTITVVEESRRHLISADIGGVLLQ